MSSELGFRLLGMFIMTFVGARFGETVTSPPITREVYSLIFGLVGALVGLILTPYFTTRPARFIRAVIRDMPIESLLTSLLGMVIGLIIAALMAVPLGLLPRPFGEWVPAIVAVISAYVSLLVFALRAPDIFRLVRTLGRSAQAEPESSTMQTDIPILVDTSVIIDGRILDIARTGFIFGSLVIPGFVLRQLQHIADESDPLRRNRGKRGLGILEELQKETKAKVRIVEIDVEQIRPVDDKLVALANEMDAYLLTTDHNLNRTATLQGVRVLNINELANAMRAMLLPGEVIALKVIAEGKEQSQGVGYLDDGTMVVVMDGRRYLDRTVYIAIERMIQTAAGKMYFARPTDNPSGTAS